MKLVKLNEVCEINIGKTPSRSNPRYWGEGNKWVTISDIRNKVINETKEEITSIAIDECNMKIVPKDTVIMSFKLSIGKVAITGEDIYTNEAIAAFPIKDKKLVTTPYLYYVLQTLNFSHITDRAVKGATLNKTKLNQIAIPLPSLDIQKQIVQVLDKVQEIIDKRKEQIQKMDEFLQSVFLDMFGDPVSNPKKLQVVKLEEIGTWQSGGTPSRKNPEYFQGEISWFTSGELNNLYICESIEKITEDAIENSSAKLIEENSLLLGMYDTAALKASINQCRCCCNQAICFAKINESKANILYVYYIIKIGRDYYKRFQRGVRQQNLNLSMIKSIEILYPPLELQNKFAEIVEQVEQQKAQMEHSLAEMENLFNSIMQKAFKGELFTN